MHRVFSSARTRHSGDHQDLGSSDFAGQGSASRFGPGCRGPAGISIPCGEPGATAMSDLHTFSAGDPLPSIATVVALDAFDIAVVWQTGRHPGLRKIV